MVFKHLEGLIAAPFTAFDDDGNLNLSLIPTYYQFLKSNGITGAFIIGSTGEGVSLTLDEKKQVIQSWATCTRNDAAFTLMPLLGGTCLRDVIELAKYAKQEGVDAVSFTAPFYFKPANTQILAAICKEVASAVPDLPFYYYHIPVLNGVGFPMFDLLKAVDNEIPNFAGVKYTHEDFMDFLSCSQYNNGKYDMLWGRDENMLAALAIGAKGAVGSTFNYAAPLYYNLIKAFEEGDLVQARILQERSISMIRLLGKYGGIATGKAYMRLIGLNCGAFRLPVQNMSESEFAYFQLDTDSIQFNSYCSRL